MKPTINSFINCANLFKYYVSSISYAGFLSCPARASRALTDRGLPSVLRAMLGDVTGLSGGV